MPLTSCFQFQRWPKHEECITLFPQHEVLEFPGFNWKLLAKALMKTFNDHSIHFSLRRTGNYQSGVTGNDPTEHLPYVVHQGPTRQGRYVLFVSRSAGSTIITTSAVTHDYPWYVVPNDRILHTDWLRIRALVTSVWYHEEHIVSKVNACVAHVVKHDWNKKRQIVILSSGKRMYT